MNITITINVPMNVTISKGTNPIIENKKPPIAAVGAQPRCSMNESVLKFVDAAEEVSIEILAKVTAGYQKAVLTPKNVFAISKISALLSGTTIAIITNIIHKIPAISPTISPNILPKRSMAKPAGY